MNYKKVFAVKQANKERILAVCPTAREESGIYIFTREADGFRYAYVGQAKNLLDRLADHLAGYDQHIDLSLKKHKLYSANNHEGWKIECKPYPLNQLDDMEQYYIKLYANRGYQMRNKTSGSQGEGKQGIADNKPAKGYWQGVVWGETRTKKKLKEFFEKYLMYDIKEPSNKIKERKKKEFQEFLES